jgi:putative membrane protein
VAALSFAYPWIKAGHLIAVIAWLAALLYLPRLYVYHCEVAAGSSGSERFKVMEHRLLKRIATPAMAAAWVFGLLLALTPGVIDWSQGWWRVKLAAVLVLSGYHGMLGRWRRDFLNDANPRSARFYRIAHHVPTVLLLVIVVMVIVRPF